MLPSLEYLSLNKIVYFIEYRWSVINASLNTKDRPHVLRENVNCHRYHWNTEIIRIFIHLQQ